MDLRPPIGIYGGTFDPVHNAHLRLAIEALEKLQLQQVIWTPVGVPSHRDPAVAPAIDRVRMLELALNGLPKFTIDDTDAFVTTPTYTVPTLLRLRKQFGPEQPLVLLLGVDAFLGLPTWMRWQALFSLAHIAVARRPGYTLQIEDPTFQAVWEDRHADIDAIYQSPAGKIVEFEMTALDIASSVIRTKMQHDESCAFLLPETVETYALRHHLYTVKTFSNE